MKFVSPQSGGCVCCAFRNFFFAFRCHNNDTISSSVSRNVERTKQIFMDLRVYQWLLDCLPFTQTKTRKISLRVRRCTRSTLSLLPFVRVCACIQCITCSLPLPPTLANVIIDKNKDKTHTDTRKHAELRERETAMDWFFWIFASNENKNKSNKTKANICAHDARTCKMTRNGNGPWRSISLFISRIHQINE